MRRQALDALLGDDRAVLSAAVDGPLRPGLATGDSQRACEAVLSTGPMQKRGKPGSSSGSSGPRLHREATRLAELALATCDIAHCASKLQIRDRSIVEAFPNFFLAMLHDTSTYPASPAKKRKWTDDLFPRVRSRLLDLIRSLLPGREVTSSLDLHDHEHIASFVCAVTALCFVAGHYAAVGSRDDGFME